jgi:ribonuclease HI
MFPIKNGCNINTNMTIRQTKVMASSLASRGVTIDIMWIAGHIGLAGNDAVDKVAKEVAKEAANPSFKHNTSKYVIKHFYSKKHAKHGKQNGK